MPSDLAHRAAVAPDALAIATRDTAWTFGRLADRARGVAAGLAARGIGPGCIVAVLGDRSAELVAVLCGILEAGAAYLPLAPSDPPARLVRLLRDSGAALVVVDGRPGPAGAAACSIDELMAPAGASGPPVRIGPDDLAYVMYTSGSAGAPKGVAVEHGALAHRLRWMRRQYRVEAGDTILQKTRLTFDVSVWELLLGVTSGAATALLEVDAEANPRAIAAAVQRHRVTLVHFVPSMLRLFLLATGPLERAALASLRRVFCSGEALPPDLATRFSETLGVAHGTGLSNLYGPTEATIDVTFHDLPLHGPHPRVPIGRPIDGAAAWVLAGDRSVPVGERGELCVGGPTLARGYVGAARRDDACFAEHPAQPGTRMYRTGDLVSVGADGALDFHGRLDRQLKIRGVRIEPAEVEAAIRALGPVRDCGVVAVGGVLHAVVVGDGPLGLAALRQRLATSLPEVMVPARWSQRAALPTTAHGKVDVAALQRDAEASAC